MARLGNNLSKEGADMTTVVATDAVGDMGRPVAATGAMKTFNQHNESYQLVGTPTHSLHPRHR